MRCRSNPSSIAANIARLKSPICAKYWSCSLAVLVMPPAANVIILRQCEKPLVRRQRATCVRLLNLLILGTSLVIAPLFLGVSAVVLSGGNSDAAASVTCAVEYKECRKVCSRLYRRAAPRFYSFCVRQCKKQRKKCLRAGGSVPEATTPAESARQIKECAREYKRCMRSCTEKKVSCTRACKKGRKICVLEARGNSRSITTPAATKNAPSFLQRQRSSVPSIRGVAPRSSSPLNPGLLDSSPGLSPNAPAAIGIPSAPRYSR
jgi:hypothetical protein